MRARPVVLNNTPLVALWIVGQLELLRELYSEVLIPDQSRMSSLLSNAISGRPRWTLPPGSRLYPLRILNEC
jgi:hypothetical protein